MPKVIKIRRGLKINLKGSVEKIIKKKSIPRTIAIKPADFYGIIPKLKVKKEDRILAGMCLFYSKKNPDILFTSPVSGIVQNIVRGERRRIVEIVIKADKEIEYKKFKQVNPLTLDRDFVKNLLLKSGLWASIKQRPYDIIANPDNIPKSIFISCFITSPLAPDVGFILNQFEEEFQTGINALSKLTNGKIYLNLSVTTLYSEKIKYTQNAEINYFKGSHPTGNVGVQINKLSPINKGELIWCVDPFHVITIGKLFKKGIYDAQKIIAATGSGVKRPKYYQSIAGVSIKHILDDNYKKYKNYRFISGNIFTGRNVGIDGYLGFYDNQITVIPEGNFYEFFGWLNLGWKKFSLSKTYLSWLMPKKKYDLSTRLNGDIRAFVFSGQYEKVFPMDIHPVFLLKAILAEDIDKMEQLGIYEVAPEDFAACEFICTSKINVQQIVRSGLDLMIKEMA